MNNPYSQNNDAYSPLFEQTYLADEEYEILNLSMPDDKLQKTLIDNLEANVDYWNQAPWKLQDTDEENVKFFLGDQLDSKEFLRDESKYIDNRLFTGIRAILSYATGQLAVPEIIPSRSDDEYLRMARSIQSALYQHAQDAKVDVKTRAAVTNLLVRKRGYLKLRYDPNQGVYGDIVTEVVNPEDLIVDRHAKFMENPNVIYHRLRCSVDELCTRFPQKANDIRAAFSIKQGRFTQMSRFVTYFEAWFTYLDQKGIPREGVCWFVPDHKLILDKQPNPNWIYTGDDKQDKQANVTFFPPKPFVSFNYLNLGHSYIDETSLFDQAKPQQIMLNRRGRQFNENVDLMNGRWIFTKAAFNEEDATKFVNRGAKSIALVKNDDATKAASVLSANAMPVQVFQSMIDMRNEIDGILGTPSVFKGSQPESKDTLGRDMMVKQQAGMLQDDLVRSVQLGMEDYYKILLQMMRVYYTDDYWFQVKGGDGKTDFIMLNGDSIDANVKIGVQVDSTLPLDKAMIRQVAQMNVKNGMTDPLTYFEDIGLPDPEIRVDRLQRYKLDPMGYMSSAEQALDNNDAETDITLLIAGKDPQERDEYDEDYLNYFNHYLTMNRFSRLQEEDPEAAQRLVTFLTVVQDKANQSANLQESMLNQAGMSDAPIQPPMPQKKVDIRVNGNIDPSQSAEVAGLQMPAGPQSPNPQAQVPPQ